jgi:DNA-binding MarR family transcriptional regulator
MDVYDAMAQRIVDLFGAIYRNLIRDEEDSISVNTNSQSALLSVLLRNGPSRMSEIGKFLKVSKPNITFLVDRLEEQGLISRESDREDRRATNICLTERGRSSIEKKKSSMHGKIVKKLSMLSSEEIQALKASLETTLDILGKLYEPGE